MSKYEFRFHVTFINLAFRNNNVIHTCEKYREKISAQQTWCQEENIGLHVTGRAESIEVLESGCSSDINASGRVILFFVPDTDLWVRSYREVLLSHLILPILLC